MHKVRTFGSEPIQGYRLLAPLGAGGYGEVWKCEAPGGLCKAIKFLAGLTSIDAAGSAGVEQEFEALQHVKSIRHPFLLAIERIEAIEDDLLIVMELAEGNLNDLFEKHRAGGRAGIPRRELLGYLRDAAEVLDAMNFERGLQHLDIKPHNLFLFGSHVKVGDFGMVKQLTDASGDGSGYEGMATPLYAAPETFLGRVSPFSDQYSLAVTYQEMLSGALPFSGKGHRQLAMQHLQSDPDLRSLPECDRLVVARALAKEPRQRYSSSSEFIEALLAQDDGAEPTTKRAAETVHCISLSDSSATPRQRDGSRQSFGIKLDTLRQKIPSSEEFQRLIAEQVGLAGAEWATRPHGSFHYRLRPACGFAAATEEGGGTERTTANLEHWAYGRIQPGLVGRELLAFEEQWQALRIDGVDSLSDAARSGVTDNLFASYLYQVPLMKLLRQRRLDCGPGLEVEIRLLLPSITTEELLLVAIRMRPIGCDDKRGGQLLTSFGVELLASLRDHLQLRPDKRIEDRLPLMQPLRVYPRLDGRILGQALAAQSKDISSQGMGLLVANRPSSDDVCIRMTASSRPEVDIPARIRRAITLNGGLFEIGVRFVRPLPSASHKCT